MRAVRACPFRTNLLSQLIHQSIPPRIVISHSDKWKLNTHTRMRLRPRLPATPAWPRLGSSPRLAAAAATALATGAPALLATPRDRLPFQILDLLPQSLDLLLQLLDPRLLALTLRYRLRRFPLPPLGPLVQAPPEIRNALRPGQLPSQLRHQSPAKRAPRGPSRSLSCGRRHSRRYRPARMHARARVSLQLGDA